MKSETTLLEIYKWLSEGKKISRVTFKNHEFLHVVDGVLVDNAGNMAVYSFCFPEQWELYQEPEEKVKWFKVTYFTKCQIRSYISNGIYTSKEDFLNASETKVDDYRWILLEEVKYE